MTLNDQRIDGRGGRSGVRVLRAEWTKFRTVRGWVWGMVGAGLVVVLIGLLGTVAPGPSSPAPALPVGPGGEPVNDSFFFVHRALTGDGSITVPVSSLTGRIQDTPDRSRSGVQPWAKAGIIVKEGLGQGSRYAAIMLTGSHGVRMQYNYTHDTAGLPGMGPRWLRLTRAGSTITGENSADGVHWTRVGTARLAGLPSTVQAGMFTTSPSTINMNTIGPPGSNPATAVGVFDHVALQGQWPGGRWKGEQLGQAGTSGSYSDTLRPGFTESGGRFTLNGAGDIAPVVGGLAFGPGITIENLLAGAFAGLIVAVIIGVVFITAEYRRGLIRTTLTAMPGRGRVLGAKAVVLGSAAFAAGLVAAAVTIPIGQWRTKAHGFTLFPVRPMTEVRVIVGTALLLAVGAVLALGVGALLRRSVVAVAIVVAAVVLPYILAISSILPAGPSNWLLRVTPAAGFAIQQTVPRYPQVITNYTPSAGYYPLAPWAGLAVMCGYAVLALTLAVIKLRRRDA